MILVLSPELRDRIREVAYRTRRETGVTLFGTRDGERCIVTAIAGPGPRATHRYAHYSGDDDHASRVFERLRRLNPATEWLGELHTHPPGMIRLSALDRQTVTEILCGRDDCHHPHEFIAGVVARHAGTVDVYPVHFSRHCLEGMPMEVEYADICAQSRGTTGLIPKTPGRRGPG